MPSPIVTGVYLTSHDPGKGKTVLRQNNWDGRTKVTKKLEAYVKIKMDEGDPNLVDVSQGGRDVFLYTNDLDLKKYNYDIQSFS